MSFYLKFLIGLTCFWVMFIGAINVIATDEVLQQSTFNGINNTAINSINLTAIDADTGYSGILTIAPSRGFWVTLWSIMTFQLPDLGFPSPIALVISSINTLIVIVAFICVYKLATPTSG